MKEAAAKATESIEASERILAGAFRKLGMTVVEPDREAFRKAAIPLHNDASVGAGWTRAQYDELQALSGERFRAKWTPVRVKKTRQKKIQSPVLILDQN